MFSAGDADQSQAIRVTFVNLKDLFNIWNGTQLWVGPPFETSENGASLSPIPSFPTSTAAQLQCEPFYTTWADLGTLHVFHEGIVPESQYAIDVINESDDLQNELRYSPELNLPTMLYGNITEDCDTDLDCHGTGSVDSSDIFAVVRKFRSEADAPVKAQTDLEPSCPDLVVSISDILSGVRAFMGLPYAFQPSASHPCLSVCFVLLP